MELSAAWRLSLLSSTFASQSPPSLVDGRVGPLTPANEVIL